MGDGNVVLIGKVMDYIIESAEEQMRKEKKLADLADAVMECRAKGILSDEEILILCHTYGLGDGYEIMRSRGRDGGISTCGRQARW